MQSKDGSNSIQAMIEERENQKASLLENFTVGYLEEMLKSTTKSIARDVVSTLINTEKAGVLLSIQKREKSSKKSTQSNNLVIQESASGLANPEILPNPDQNKTKSNWNDKKTQGVLKTTKAPAKAASSQEKRGMSGTRAINDKSVKK